MSGQKKAIRAGKYLSLKGKHLLKQSHNRKPNKIPGEVFPAGDSLDSDVRTENEKYFRQKWGMA